MLALLISSIIITSAPNSPTEIIGSAATPDGGRDEIFVEQPQNAQNPFGTPPTETLTNNSNIETLNTNPPNTNQEPFNSQNAPQQASPNISAPLVNQSSEVNPTDMNPLDYKNQIENTIYQSGDRLIDVQSIPLKDISSAVQPNLQPEITDYPAL